MPRLNQTTLGPNRPPKGQRPDPHGSAVREAFTSGLADYCRAHGLTCPDGSPAVYTARQRRLAEAHRARNQVQQ